MDAHGFGRSARGIDREQLTALVLETALSPLIVWDEAGQVLLFNNAAVRAFGYPADELKDLTRRELIHAEEQQLAERLAATRRRGDRQTRRFRRRMITKRGRTLYLDCASSAIPLGDGRVGVLVEYRDVTEQVAVELRLREQERLYRSIYENADAAIFTTGADNRFFTANPASLRLLAKTMSELRQITPLDLVHPDFQASIGARRSARSPDQQEPDIFEVPVRVAHERYAWLSVSMFSMFRADGSFDGSQGFARDVTEERIERDRLQSEATTDGLTGLRNRRWFDEQLERRLVAARRHGVPLSLLLIDLDHFKEINDQYGHPAGDAVLRTVAEALTAEARVADVVTRYGGEEFCVILPNTDQPHALAAAHRYLDTIRNATTVWDDRRLGVTASGGIASLDVAADSDGHALLRAADAAVYEAKRLGRDRVAVAPFIHDGRSAA